MQRAIWVLWPSFLVAAAAVGVCFSLVDPTELHVFVEPVELSRMAIYTVGFFAFWAFGAASSAITCFLQKPAGDINNFCPLPPPNRPVGCPRRDCAHQCAEHSPAA